MFATAGISSTDIGDDFSSNDSHRESFDSGLEVLLENPIGRGLATAAGAGHAPGSSSGRSASARPSRRPT